MDFEFSKKLFALASNICQVGNLTLLILARLHLSTIKSCQIQRITLREKHMIIADLNYLETASEEFNIVGASWWRKPYIPVAKADAIATSTAIGFRASSYTYTDTQAVAGLFASSTSASSAYAAG
jgi:hypothetical protein